jgi:uncharacterized protein YecE (DUF72 family)
MIQIGLSGWGDHVELYEKGVKPRDKLKIYSNHFSIVELDSSFYAILSQNTYKNWVQVTPNGFSFIIKAYQGMTGHQRDKKSFIDNKSMFQDFYQSINPVLESGKLKAVLFQYPPWFDCKRENVEILRKTKEQMKDIPLALEFRHQSWFTPNTRKKTLAFMEKEGWIHSICDEPQAGVGSIPIVLHPTNAKLTIVRMHGRNISGWNQSGAPNWREVRYLYCYSKDELLDWMSHLEKLQEKSNEVCVIFNNNSGGDAAYNARDLMRLHGLQPNFLDSRQLDMFE